MKFLPTSIRAVVVAVLLATGYCAHAEDATLAIEQTLVAAQAGKRGVNLYVDGQVIPGLVVRVEPGQWVELRNQQFTRIVVRLDRIAAVAQP